MGRIAELLALALPGRAASGRVRAVWNGAVIAASDDTIVLEGRHYFPMESVDRRYLHSSGGKTLCPWKGVASYWSLEVDGERNDAAAWCYPHPSPLAARIKGRVAFWQGVTVEEATSARVRRRPSGDFTLIPGRESESGTTGRMKQ